MEEKLLAKLNDGETLLWSAKPEAFKTLDETYRAPIVQKIIIIMLCIAILIGWYLSAVSAKGDSVQILSILACLSPLLCVWTDFSDAIKVRKQVIYGLTDQRLLTLVGNQLHSLDYSCVHNYEVMRDAAGHVSLICGEAAMKAADKTRREATVCGARMNADTGMCESFAMYAIPEADKVKDLVAKLMK